MDETNEDSWLYGTSNPDSTTNETQDEANVAGNAENLAPSHKTDAENATSDILVETKEEPITHDEYDDPAQEMEEDEEATAATAADTTDTDGGGNACVEGDDNQDSGDGQTKQQQKLAVGSDDDDDDSDDDDINVVIGDIKAAPSSYNIKQRGNLMATGQGGQDKPKGTSQGGKFSMEDFEGVGTINGVAAHEFSIDSLEDKPWRKPGADITDYFNYGFNEETWRAYCERQKRFRVSESGVGLASLTQNLNQSERHGNEHGGLGLLPPPGSMLPPNAMMHDSMQGVPPGGMMPPPIGVHHHGAPMQRLPMRPRQLSTLGNAGNTSKENAIQVMTAECREYSRPGQMGSNFSGPTPSEEPFFPEPETFDYGYEPTQESQWGNNDNSGWVPTGIKELTPGPALVAPPMAGPPSGPPPGTMPPGPPMAGPPPTIRGPPPMMGNMPPNMGMGPPPHVMMMGPVGGPMNLPPMGPRMIPPQMGGPGGPPTMAPNQNRPDDRMRSPSRRNRSRSPQRSRRRSKTPTSQRQRRSRSKSRKPRSRSRSKSRKPRSTRRSVSKSRRSTSKSRRSPSKSRNSRKSTRTQRSPSQSKSRSKRHSRTRSKSPKASSSNSAKKRTEKTEK